MNEQFDRHGATVGEPGPDVRIRKAEAGDVAAVVTLDEHTTGVRKEEYWNDLFDRYHTRHQEQRVFLVAEVPAGSGDGILGFITGEVRAWEFGSAPCGWIFAISVEPETRLAGIGRRLFEAAAEVFRKAGVTKMRTMLARDNHLLMSFFRSQGMMAGPYIQLEMDIDDKGVTSVRAS